MIIENQSAKVIVKALQKFNIAISEEVAMQVVIMLSQNDLPLSRKEMKKARQQYKKEAETVFSRYSTELNSRVSNFEGVIKAKPPLIPVFAWNFIKSLVVDEEKLNKPNLR